VFVIIPYKIFRRNYYFHHTHTDWLSRWLCQWNHEYNS